MRLFFFFFFFTPHPQGYTSFPTTSNPEMRFGLSQTQSELLQLIKQKVAGWTERQRSTNPSTQPPATVDTRLRVRFPGVAWHLSRRDGLAYLVWEGGGGLGGGGQIGDRLGGFACVSPFRLIFYGCAIQSRWQFEMTERRRAGGKSSAIY